MLLQQTFLSVLYDSIVRSKNEDSWKNIACGSSSGLFKKRPLNEQRSQS